MPEGQLQGVMEVVEHGGRAVANAPGTRRAKVVVNCAENFILN